MPRRIASAPKSLEEITAGESVKMTATLKRLFLWANCDPACHVCDKSIKIGRLFRLVSVESTWGDPPEWEDEMVCFNHGYQDIWDKRSEDKAIRESEVHRGYTRPSA